MESNAKYFFVGFSLVALLALGAYGVTWLLRSNTDADQKLFLVYFRKNSLAGVTPGSAVTMRGLPVGAVRSLDFIENDIEGVRVVLAVKDFTPVKTDTQAVVQRNIVTGQAVIELIKSSQAAPLLITAGENSKYPVIQEGEGEVEAIRNKVPEILDHSNRILEKMQAVFTAENVSNVSQLLENVRKATDSLASKEGSPGELLAELQNTIKEIRQTSSALRQAIVTDILPAVKGVTQKTEAAAETARLSAARIAEAAGGVAGVAQSFENPRSLITGPAAADLGPGE